MNQIQTDCPLTDWLTGSAKRLPRKKKPGEAEEWINQEGRLMPWRERWEQEFGEDPRNPVMRASMESEND